MKRWRYALLSLLGVAVAAPLLVPPPPQRGTLPPEELADPDSRFMSFGGLRVHYKIAGHGRPAFLLLHGFAANVFSWREVMEGLAKRGTVVAFDRPASGLTARPMPGQWAGRSPYSAEAAAGLAVTLMNALALQRPILVGHSAGASLALLVALQHPERVQALVLANPAVYHAGTPEWLKPALATPWGRFYGPLFVRYFFQLTGMNTLRQAWHDPSRIKPEDLAGYRKVIQVRNWDRALWEFTVASQRFDPARLGEIRQPTLILAGGSDRMAPREEAPRLAGALPNARLTVIANCGHLLQEECPGAFLQAVDEFLAAL